MSVVFVVFVDVIMQRHVIIAIIFCVSDSGAGSWLGLGFSVFFLFLCRTAVRPSLKLTLGHPWDGRAEVTVSAPSSSFFFSLILILHGCLRPSLQLTLSGPWDRRS